MIALFRDSRTKKRFPFRRLTRYSPPREKGRAIFARTARHFPFVNLDLLIMALAFTAATLFSLRRRLPTQNALLAAAIIAAIAAGVHTLSLFTGIPFGKIHFNPEAGPRLFGALPAAIPLIWIVFIMNSRGVAQLILRRSRAARTYGFRVMALTTALVLLLYLGFEPLATQAKQYWSWTPSRVPENGYGAPWHHFLAWTVTTLLILLAATPSFINKKPGEPPPNYFPLFLWLALILLFLSSALANRQWLAATILLASLVVPTTLALRASR